MEVTSLVEKIENTPQNPSSTPGWNDPPPSNVFHLNQTNNNRLHLQRLRRPVDPSVQGNPIINTPSQQNTKLQQQEFTLSTPATTTNFHQSRSFPQLHSHDPQMAAIGTHPGSAFTPTFAQSISNAADSSQSQTALFNKHNYPVANPSSPHMPTFHPHPHSHPNLLAATQTTMAPNLLQHQPAAPMAMQSIPPLGVPMNAQPIQQNVAIMDHHYPYYSPPQQDPLQINQTAQNNPTLPSNTNINPGGSLGAHQPPNIDPRQQQSLAQNIPNNNSTTMMTTIASSPNTNEEPSNGQIHPMIFSPPNIVPLRGMDQHNRPTTQPVTADYRIPVKAAGDVSLSGIQLTAFLTKATLLLPQGPMREGIQLRINQFAEFVKTEQISESCLKKLNFVVDAIDRHIYDEAWQFFEQMLATYPNDCAIGGWAHGVRLLIQELRKGGQIVPNRAHSAGTRHF